MTTLYGQLLKNKETLGPNLAKLIEKMVVFDITNVAEYYWKSEKTDWDITKNDFPNLAPPYPLFFMQYKLPRDYIIAEEGVQKDLPETHYGFLFQARKIDDENRAPTWNEEMKWMVSFEMFAYVPGYELEATNMDVQMTIGIDAQGVACTVDKTAEGPLLVSFPRELVEVMSDPEERRLLINQVFAILHPALLAISFLHCRNVKVEDKATTMGKSKSVKRRARRAAKGEPYYKQNIIEIRPMRRVLETEGQSETHGLKKALHICRGHFRHYEEGRGLFGKIHGTFWIDSHVRGAPEVGIVDKTYNINPPEEK